MNLAWYVIHKKKLSLTHTLWSFIACMVSILSCGNIIALIDQCYADSSTDAYLLGNRYFIGYGVSVDKSKAFKFWLKAALCGHQEAQNTVAECYSLGMGVSKDKQMAVYWWHRAADGGNVEAQVKLAECYLNGDGIQKNTEQGLFWMEKAIKQKQEEVKRRADFYGFKF